MSSLTFSDSTQTFTDPSLRPTVQTLRPPFSSLSPSPSLEEIHFNIAQEISRAISTTTTTTTTPPPLSLISPIKNPLLSPPLPLPIRPKSFKKDSSVSPLQKPTPLSQPRAPVVKPSPAEEELVRRIHRKVGGPSKLSTYDDPAKVRHVVIEALAHEQTNLSDAARIRKGQLSVFERRVVRTVTNRGAAVRSRMRQRKEVAQLKNELRVRDGRVKHLENLIRALCAKYAAPLPDAFTRPASMHAANVSNVLGVGRNDLQADSHSTTVMDRAGIATAIQPPLDAPDFALDQDLFGSLVDQMISHTPWS